MATASTVPVTFTYRSSSANSVEVAGNWDQWKGRVALSKVAGVQEEGLDLWQATQHVPPSSKVAYKYILNGDDWHTRDDLPTETDANGNKNNYLQSPEAGHAASDEQQAKTTADLVGASFAESVGAAIATVTGTDPFASEPQEVQPTAGVTAPRAETSAVREAEKPSALAASSPAIPAGAAPVSSGNGQVPHEQLSNLALSDGHSPADAGAAAIAAAAAGATGAVAAGQATGQGNTKPTQLDTVAKSDSVAPPSKAPISAAAPAGTLDQTDAVRGLDAGASGSAPSTGAPKAATSQQSSSVADSAKGALAGVAAAGAGAAGVAAATAAAARDKVSSTSNAPNVEEKANPAVDAPSTHTPKASSAANTAAASQPSKDVQAAADKAVTGGGAAAAVPAAAAKPTEVEKKQEQVSSGPAATAQQPVPPPKDDVKAARESPVTKDSALSHAAASTAAAGTAATAVHASQQHKGETAAKQEQLASGPQSASTDTRGAAPALVDFPKSTPSHPPAVAASEAPAVAPSQPSATKTPAADKALPATAVAATVVGGGAAAASNGGGLKPTTPTSSAPGTPAKGEQGTRRGSRFGTSRKSRAAATEASDAAETNSISSTALPSPGGTQQAGGVLHHAGHTGAPAPAPEHRGLERSRKKSSFFAKIKEKLSSSPAKNKE
ncbi:unnamed protein product [Parajaminaea phylloscopi]